MEGFRDFAARKLMPVTCKKDLIEVPHSRHTIDGLGSTRAYGWPWYRRRAVVGRTAVTDVTKPYP